MDGCSSKAPRLLVSVRNVAEAEAALAGGCDVLDLKEPSRGAMGMADVATIAAVVARVCELQPSIPVSAALGEAAEWPVGRVIPRLPAGITYLKLGTAGLGTVPDWAFRFNEVKRRFEATANADDKPDAKTGIGQERRAEKWIAVGYADWDFADGPNPDDVLRQARLCGCAGVLIDTYSKASGRLRDWLSVERLASLAELARRQSLEFAVAGRLQIYDLAGLCAVRPDIVGIRSAACRAGIRLGEIDAAAVRAFREALSCARWLAPGIVQTTCSIRLAGDTK